MSFPHTEPPVTTAAPATPAPTDEQQALAALDDVMDQAAIAANAQRDEEAGTPPTPSTRQEAQTDADSGGQVEEDEDEEEEAESEPVVQAQEDTSAASLEAEQPKYSRRDAARFAQELETTKRDAQEAKAIAARAQAELNSARAADTHILTQLAEVSGYTRDANGRFKYDNLKDKVLNGTATEAERQEVAEMTQWHQLAGPIYRQAEHQVTQAFSVDWKSLKDLDGVGDKGLEKLAQAPNGVAGAREMHALAFAAGEKKANAAHEATIARLKAENKSLRTGQVARAPQPAVANGAAVPAGGGWRDRAFGPDGLPSEEFDREVRAGKWLGVDLSNQS